ELDVEEAGDEALTFEARAEPVLDHPAEDPRIGEIDVPARLVADLVLVDVDQDGNRSGARGRVDHQMDLRDRADRNPAELDGGADLEAVHRAVEEEDEGLVPVE